MTDSKVNSGVSSGLESGADPRTEVREKALILLARREHSRGELSRKLGQRGFGIEMVTLVLDELEDEQKLSDRRFAERYVSARASRGYGPLRIRAELGERGIRGALIHEVLEVGPGDWHRRASDARTKRFGPARPESWREKARQARFLAYRGFEAEQIRSAVDDETGTFADDLGENT